MGITDVNKVNLLRSYLNFKARVEISDGRIFIGTFVCIDKQKNLILAQAEEYRKDEQRLVGLVMIPGVHLVKMETEDLDLYT
ncbi:hypothetical protein BC941DRAFT_382686 [Chlamydoabsidia padenii]|nr:hypothetical protein BC941DRAFT_382686 [Chlamydoabsidia padenii]